MFLLCFHLSVLCQNISNLQTIVLLYIAPALHGHNFVLLAFLNLLTICQNKIVSSLR